jgi:hypothetical protein
MRREALVWRQLRHDHVLPFLGLDDTLFPGNKFSCMISPWMKRGMLLEYVKTRDYCPERDLLRMVRAISKFGERAGLLTKNYPRSEARRLA